jgi:predicted transcriptional regulator
MAAATAKQEVEQLLEQLPDTSTLEDIQYHLYVLEKIKRGRSDIANGRSYTAEEARKRLSRWQKQ